MSQLEHEPLWYALEILISRSHPSIAAKIVDGLWKVAEQDEHGASDAWNDIRVKRVILGEAK